MSLETFTTRKIFTGLTFDQVLPTIETFLTSDTDLVNAGETWTVVFSDTPANPPDGLEAQRLVVRSPGYNPTYEQATWLMTLYKDATNGKYGSCIGYTENWTSGADLVSQPGSPYDSNSSQYGFGCMPFSASGIELHLMANAVCFKAVAFTSTNNHSYMAGHLISFSTRAEWEKPLFFFGPQLQPDYNMLDLPDNSYSQGHKRLWYRKPDGVWVVFDMTERKQVTDDNWERITTDTGAQVGVFVPMRAVGIGLVPAHYWYPDIGINQNDFMVAGTRRYTAYDDNNVSGGLYFVSEG